MSNINIPPDKLPRHVAIIMDGNGRWALSRGLPRLMGHKAGTENLRRVIRATVEFGVKYLTIYAFSTENWGRPPEEVKGLMYILEDVIDRADRRQRLVGEDDPTQGDAAEQCEALLGGQLPQAPRRHRPIIKMPLSGRAGPKVPTDRAIGPGPRSARARRAGASGRDRLASRRRGRWTLLTGLSRRQDQARPAVRR